MAKSKADKDSEFHPDAWERFERAADKVVKAPPQHRAKGRPTKRAAKARSATRRSEKA